jgi:hypothetical protein
MFDYDDDVNIVFDAKIAGKNLVAAKHELLTKTGDFLFMAHSERELAYRMQMVEEDIEKTAYRKLSSVSDSKAKLVRAVLEEWQIRHASCQFCKSAAIDPKDNNNKKDDLHLDKRREDVPSTDGTHRPVHPDSVLHPNMPVADGTNINPKDPDKRTPHTWDPNVPHAPILRPKKIENNPPWDPNVPHAPILRPKKIENNPPYNPNVPHAPILRPKKIENNPPYNPPGCEICDEYNKHNH